MRTGCLSDPSGVLGELGICFRAIPTLLAGGFSGVAGASPVLSHVIRPLLASAPRWLPGGSYTLLLALYVAGFPGLYLYMFAQRKKVLGGGKAQKKRG